MALPPRRNLTLNNLDEALAEAEQLLANGYRQAGNWNLAQVLGHCTDWLRFPLDGYPPAKFPLSLIMRLVRITMGQTLYRKVIRDRGFKPGSLTMPSTVKRPNTKQDAAALEEFEIVVNRFKRFANPPQPSPLFGKLTYEQHLELQVIHLQHHLAFLIPNDSP